jgi:outer membrane protein TolC
VVQSELDVSSQELSLAQAKQASAAAMETLKTDLGMPSYEQVRVNPVIRVIEIHPQLQTALDAAFKSNRQVKSAEIALKEAQRGLDIDANSRLWDLDLTLNHRQGYANTSGFTPYSPLYPGQDRSTGGDTSIGLSLTVPLDQDVERTQASLEAAVSDENAELALASARRTLKSTVETQLQTLNSAWEQIDLSRSQLTLTKESLDSAKVQFDYGKMDAFTYSQQQSGLVSAQLAVVSAEINYMTQYYQYQSITDALLPSWGVYVKALEK